MTLKGAVGVLCIVSLNLVALGANCVIMVEVKTHIISSSNVAKRI